MTEEGYLGLLTSDVHYFKVKLQSESEIEQFGLLRVGSVEGSLILSTDKRLN